jgi:uncharacterized protein (DUF302 family)
MPGITVNARSVRHVAIATGRPYADFRAAYESAVPAFDRLEAVGVVLSGVGWPGIEGLSRNTATHGLVSFFTFDPSPVMKLNGSGRRGVTYLSGNIVEAEKGFRVDPACFLYLPLRMMISEDVDGTAVLSFDVPADLFEAFPGAALAPVAATFTRTLAQLLEHLGLPVPCELVSADGDQ